MNRWRWLVALMVSLLGPMAQAAPFFRQQGRQHGLGRGSLYRQALARCSHLRASDFGAVPVVIAAKQGRKSKV